MNPTNEEASSTKCTVKSTDTPGFIGTTATKNADAADCSFLPSVVVAGSIQNTAVAPNKSIETETIVTIDTALADLSGVDINTIDKLIAKTIKFSQLIPAAKCSLPKRKSGSLTNPITVQNSDTPPATFIVPLLVNPYICTKKNQPTTLQSSGSTPESDQTYTRVTFPAPNCNVPKLGLFQKFVDKTFEAKEKITEHMGVQNQSRTTNSCSIRNKPKHQLKSSQSKVQQTFDGEKAFVPHIDCAFN
jgi:hypothetical protein